MERFRSTPGAEPPGFKVGLRRGLAPNPSSDGGRALGLMLVARPDIKCAIVGAEGGDPRGLQC